MVKKHPGRPATAPADSHRRFPVNLRDRDGLGKRLKAAARDADLAMTRYAERAVESALAQDGYGRKTR